VSFIDSFNLAVSSARGRGYEVTGWTLQYDPSYGFVSWLYHEDTDGNQASPFSDTVIVDFHDSIEDCAKECLELAKTLPIRSDIGLA